MDLTFNKIKKGNIFASSFETFEENNILNFSGREKIIVVYGPNGTGKSSFIKVLKGDDNSEIEFEYEGNTYNSGEQVFHIIDDQNARNIIKGDTKDFFLGDNIQRVFELEDLLTEKRQSFLNSVLDILKSFNVSKKKSPFIELFANESLKLFLSDCANNKSRGENFSIEQIIDLFTQLHYEDLSEFEEEKLKFFINDYSSKKSIINQLESLSDVDLIPNEHVHEIEENTEAITILTRFSSEQCIVCDNDNINRDELLARKTANREAIKAELEPKINDLLENITEQIPFGNDSFGLKDKLMLILQDANRDILESLLVEIDYYKIIYVKKLKNNLVDAFTQSELEGIYREYIEIIEGGINITDDDLMYIDAIVNKSMSKELTFTRDNDRKLIIQLSDDEFLGKDRDSLPLSSGEQNFLSLTFEFLKAKKSNSPIVVIDDPISSFDSIYKNKVIFSIVKMLQSKKRIILTHNIDMVRLLQSQYKDCFSFYLLNNTDGEVNGFISINSYELKMLINLTDLLQALRTDVPMCIVNMPLFLISMIPFMRGYANIIDDQELKEKLTQVMHGYKTERVNIAGIYARLFGVVNPLFNEAFEVSVPDILTYAIGDNDIVDKNTFPLLNRTLKHSFTYLYLRLIVEKTLVERSPNINTEHDKQLGQIIAKAFNNATDDEQVKKRIELTSKKTLINEFNHFEGNMSIFQPAIDITDKSLKNEYDDIISLLSNL